MMEAGVDQAEVEAPLIEVVAGDAVGKAEERRVSWGIHQTVSV